ncbi:MAG: hypothetical protein CMJ64_26260 [Planctomycetaceae bacterium]|nr:hypothetical protein [Planctomycetaceae bacterium]
MLAASTDYSHAGITLEPVEPIVGPRIRAGSACTVCQAVLRLALRFQASPTVSACLPKRLEIRATFFGQVVYNYF